MILKLTKASITGISLDSAGLVALADLATIAERTALIGTSWWTDVLFIAPGIHTQQNASSVNGGELPTAGGMTSGYVFRIENQAMVFYMQRIGRTGHLVEIKVERIEPSASILSLRWPSISELFYAFGVVLTIACIAVLSRIRDFWALGVLGLLMLARAMNVFAIRRRAKKGQWKGADEVGNGDLLVLLSQDRWVRIHGTLNDLKQVTAGQSLADAEAVESFAAAGATLLVYSAAALAANASTVGSLILALLLLLSVGALGLCNNFTADLHMFGCRVYIVKEPRRYERRLHMANEMIQAHGGRMDWAVNMDLVLPESVSALVPGYAWERWQPEIGVPPRAINAANDPNNPVYVARGIILDPESETSSLSIGRGTPSGQASFAYRDREYITPDFQVLCGEQGGMEWVTINDELSERKLQGKNLVLGAADKSGNATFIARAKDDTGRMHVGRVRMNFRAHFSGAGTAYTSSAYDVLCWT